VGRAADRRVDRKLGRGLVPAPGESPDGPDRQPGGVQLADPYALGGEFFSLGVRRRGRRRVPRDQSLRPAGRAGGEGSDEPGAATGKDPALEPEGSLDGLLAQARPGDYVCVQAFVEPSDENDRRLADLVAKLRRRSGLVVTHGYGPRYLHSTGQLHKGGPNTGLFLQLVDDPGKELAIPGQPFGFRRLIQAQAAGDFESLRERGRRIARIRWEDL